MSGASTPSPPGWHISRSIQPGLIAALLLQLLGFSWWASKVDQRISYLESTVLSSSDLGDRTTRLEATLDGVRATVNRVESKLDRIVEDR